VNRIQEITDRHGLKIIYDAAHTFGVQYQGTSLLNFGDISTLSFHATKLFHTIEGGALVANDEAVAHRIMYMRNFGHKGTEDFFGLGINGKNTEMNAAMGLCVLPYVPDLINKRRVICDRYRELLRDSGLVIPAPGEDTKYNYSYFPVLFNSEDQLLGTIKRLNENEIFPRRYFYPSLNHLPYVEYVPMPVAEDVARRVICLPLNPELPVEDVSKISEIICSGLR
ncbi:MAG: DegT/DnrJ/EryC1/StrS family aminotransferase, partial [Bacteroidales bacterium]|nr:DegT/DnrJ/EryC1/StrS family aminotransferase [Bacteroidales bacterium]